jgi:hypothetical protein
MGVQVLARESIAGAGQPVTRGNRTPSRCGICSRKYEEAAQLIEVVVSEVVVNEVLVDGV